jgi:hypothetical protein
MSHALAEEEKLLNPEIHSFTPFNLQTSEVTSATLSEELDLRTIEVYPFTPCDP